MLNQIVMWRAGFNPVFIMSGIILDVDKFSGVTEVFNKDNMTGKVTVTKTQDTSKIFKANIDEQNAIGNNTWQGDMHKVASIPMVIVEQWYNELKAMGAQNPSPLHPSNQKFIIAKLNNRDFAKLRTKNGRI